MIQHQYKNITLDLPKKWVYEKEEEDLEACFNPHSQSTLRIHLMQTQDTTNRPKADLVISLTDKLNYIITNNNYYLTNIQERENIERDTKLTLLTWRLIQICNNGFANTIVFTYTVLSADKKSEKEKNIIVNLEKSFANAVFS